MISLNIKTCVVTAIVLLSMPFALSAATASGNPPHLDTVAPTGSVHDFDYFLGSGWITYQHRLKTVGGDGKDWENFMGYLCATPYLGGMATVDELYFPSKGSSGLTLRTFDPEKHQWSIYWVSSRNGKLDTKPEVGGFKGNLGAFYGHDVDGKGRPVEVRYLWKIIDHDHARWEQAFSYDNRTWETNWTADFVRAARSKVCNKDGLPKR